MDDSEYARKVGEILSRVPGIDDKGYSRKYEFNKIVYPHPEKFTEDDLRRMGYLPEKKESKMCWNDVRKKLPEEDQNCLICYLEEDGDFIYHRAYFCEGSFRSLENHSSYPLVAELWIPIPECKEVE